jgi:anti-sigma28 factor (negative regulator of flagellin synthesis)
MLDLDTISAVRETATGPALREEAAERPYRPQARRARIARLSRQVADGTYAIDHQMVAGTILDRISVPRSAT